MKFDITKPYPQEIRSEKMIGYCYKFSTLEELQDAIGEMIKVANAAKSVPEWIFLDHCDGMSDSYGRIGYVGLKIAQKPVD